MPWRYPIGPTGSRHICVYSGGATKCADGSTYRWRNACPRPDQSGDGWPREGDVNKGPGTGSWNQRDGHRGAAASRFHIDHVARKMKIVELEGGKEAATSEPKAETGGLPGESVLCVAVAVGDEEQYERASIASWGQGDDTAKSVLEFRRDKGRRDKIPEYADCTDASVCPWEAIHV